MLDHDKILACIGSEVEQMSADERGAFYARLVLLLCDIVDDTASIVRAIELARAEDR